MLTEMSYPFLPSPPPPGQHTPYFDHQRRTGKRPIGLGRRDGADPIPYIPPTPQAHHTPR